MSRFFIILSFLILGAFAQKTSAQADYVFKVVLKDKQGSPGSIQNPSTYLSPRAVARKNRLGVVQDSTDLPVSTSYLNSLLGTPGTSLHGTSKWINAAYIVTSDPNYVNIASNFSFVDTAYKIAYYPNGYGLVSDTPHSDEANSTVSSDKTYSYGSAATQIQMHNGQLLHLDDYTGSGMMIAVMDDGFDGTSSSPGFVKLRNENRIKATYNFPKHSTDVEQGFTHGTGVLGILAAEINGTYVGTAPDADYVLLATEDSRSEQPIELENWIMGLEFADSMGADVISSSLGYNTFDDPTQDLSKTQLDGESVDASRAASMASAKGIIVVNSSGNEGTGSFWDQVLFPSDAKNILTVGGVSSSGNPIIQGGHGMTVDGRIKPEVAAMSTGVSLLNSNGSISNGSGNSYSTPIIAGLVACLWQIKNTLTATEVMDYVKQYSSFYSNPNQYIGYGIPDFGPLVQLLDVHATQNVDEVMVYPNPVLRGTFTVAMEPNVNIKKLKVIDINGKIADMRAYDDNSNVRTIHKLLVPGSYILLIYTDDSVLYDRISVQ